VTGVSSVGDSETPLVGRSLADTADPSLTDGTPESSRLGGGGFTASGETVAMPIAAGATTTLPMPGRTGGLRYMSEPLVMRSPKPSSCEKA